MTVETNLEQQLGADWAIAFTSDEDLTGAELSFALTLDDDLAISHTDADSPSGISVDSPAVTGTVAITPADQADLVPAVYAYEIRAMLNDDRTVILQFGRLTTLASLFGWPVAS